MTPFTLVLAYYENAGMLREQAWKWLRLSALVRQALHVVIVDDGSPKDHAELALEPGMWATLSAGLASVQLWRMGVDVRWNQDACRNVGVRESKSQWLVLTDMDHVVPDSTWRRLMEYKLNKHAVYRFARVTAPELKPYKSHPNSWAMTRNAFWTGGGYDEALAGHYGTDGDFLVRMRAKHEVIQLGEELIRYPRDVIADASTTTLTRKTPEDKQAINRLLNARDYTPDWKPAHFLFPCARVL